MLSGRFRQGPHVLAPGDLCIPQDYPAYYDESPLFSSESSGKGLTSENKACIITAIRFFIFIQSILGGMSMNIIRRVVPEPQFFGNRTVSAKMA